MSAGQRSGGNDGAEMDILYIAGGILVVFALVLYFFHVQLVRTVFFVKYYELQLIALFLPQYHVLADWVSSVPAEKVSLLNMVYVSKMVGEVMRYPMILISLGLAAVVYLFHSDSSYRAIETMDSLSEKMKSQFPASQVVSGLDLAAVPIEEGPWAMALTPIEFAKKYKLLLRDPATYQIKVDRLKAKIVFSGQLGRLWKGIDELLPHERAIFGVLAAYVNYNRKDAEAALETISSECTQDQLNKKVLNYAVAERLLAQYGNTSAVKAVVEKHAYVLTVFVAMLSEARKTGIVANSSYLWLKPVDRVLWYVLNNVGRKAVFIETGAVHGHWLVETSVGFPLYQPMVDEAILGLEEAVQSRVIKGDV